MAELLEVNSMLARTYEPKRAFRFTLDIAGIDAFTLKAAARPAIRFEETVLDYLNSKRYVAGKGEWSTIAVQLQDPIAPSAAQKVIEWVRRNYETKTGRSGYHTFYTEDINIKMLDPVGAVVEQWRGEGAWPVSVDWNGTPLDYASSEACTIALEIRADRWILEF